MKRQFLVIYEKNTYIMEALKPPGSTRSLQKYQNVYVNPHFLIFTSDVICKNMLEHMPKMNGWCRIFLTSATFRPNGWQNPFIVCYFPRFYNASNLFQVRRKVKTSWWGMRQTRMTRQRRKMKQTRMKKQTKQTKKFRTSAEEQRRFARRWLIGGEIYCKFECQFHRKHLSFWFPLFLLIHSCFLSTQRQIKTRISPKL